MWCERNSYYAIWTCTSKQELDNLRSIVTRSLKDVTAAGLSADTRFVPAYDAARSLVLMIVRAEGYRPRSVGGHYNTFLALGEAGAAFSALAVYFDTCRMKRNDWEYDFAGGVSDTEAESLLQAVHTFAADADTWMRAHHPQLV